jgi:putative RNA 2'-phosphotransferase
MARAALSWTRFLREGIRKMRRHHVHLSADVPTAIKVGSRHGQPVVFAVDAAIMSQDGVHFYRSENGVWLVDAVAPRYLRLLEPADANSMRTRCELDANSRVEA